MLPFGRSALKYPHEQAHTHKKTLILGRGWDRGENRSGDRDRERAGRGPGAARLYLVVLVGSDGDEVGLGEHVGAEGAVGQLEDVVGPDYVEPGLVLVHGVQDGLGG